MVTSNEKMVQCYSRLLAIEKNLPSTLEVSEQYVQEFLDVVREVENATGRNLDKFTIPEDSVRKVVIASSPRRKVYSPIRKCERTFLLMKIQGLLSYLQLQHLTRERPEQPEIGFRDSE